MKFLLNDRYLITPDVLTQILEVESGGSYSDRFYKIIGEPIDITVIKDSQVVQGDAAKQKDEEYASEKLKETEKELKALKLKTARMEAMDRILKEKRGLSRADVEAYVNQETTIYFLDSRTSDDVRKWLREQD